ncbi:hypothetical protein SAMN04488062_103186 [Flavobacterium omnivorum]|uniref:Uncharacterized protein n=1 Tax=Flavobacterium omnivorum TaxID=178355 RepID=A0A1G7YGA4_9FLAO|nr:hypothetical protein SAMN04488062_103186 [Flavobacterium omnivorum]
MQTTQDILDELIFHFDKVTALMDKYPNAIQILNNEEYGLSLDVNLSLIEIYPREEY